MERDKHANLLSQYGGIGTCDGSIQQVLSQHFGKIVWEEEFDFGMLNQVVVVQMMDTGTWS